jgi:hypothetical protein
LAEEWPVLKDKTSDTYRDGMDNGMTRAKWKEVCLELRNYFAGLNKERSSDLGQGFQQKWDQ